MNMLDLNDFRKITWPCGHFEQPFWEFNTVTYTSLGES
jgi:hypothetical protein